MKWPNVNLNEGTVSRTSTSLLLRAQADDSDAWEQLVNTYSRRVYRWCRHAGLQPADAGNVVQEVLRSVARKLPEFHRDRRRDTFRGWLRRITQNKLRDHFRSLMRHPDQAVGGTDAHRRLMRISTDSPRGAAPDDPVTDSPRGELPMLPSSESQRGSAVDSAVKHEAGRHAREADELCDITLTDYGLSDWGQALVQRIRSQCSDRDWRFFWRVVVDGQSAVEVGAEYGVSANTVRLVKMRILRRLRQSLADTETKPSGTNLSGPR